LSDYRFLVLLFGSSLTSAGAGAFDPLPFVELTAEASAGTADAPALLLPVAFFCFDWLGKQDTQNQSPSGISKSPSG